MPSVNKPAPTGHQYWRSLEHFAETEEFRDFLYREFPAGASEMLDSGERRHFLKIMGASLALAGLGLSGCRRWPREQIVPFASRPEGRVPGQAEYYATSMERGGVSIGLLAASQDGRPIKIEGNPDHPDSLGATDVFAQASVLDLYDPDRSRMILRDGAPSNRADFAAFAADHFGDLADQQGSGLAVLCEQTSSPSMMAMRDRFLARFPQTKWLTYEAIDDDNAAAGAKLAFGAPHRVHNDLSEADIIVSLDADLFGPDEPGVRNTRAFARGRRRLETDGRMNRLYAFEPDLSVTGACADERAAVRRSEVAVIAAYMAARILGRSELSAIEESAAGRRVLTEAVRERADHAIADLQSHRGHGLLAAGRHQPAQVHLLVHLMNAALGNAGTTVSYSRRPDETPSREAIRQAAQGMDDGSIQTLLIIGTNPAFTAPADLDFESKLANVPVSIHLSDYVDETSSLCTWHVNRAHYLEAWGDGRASDGTHTLAQPLIEPLWSGSSAIELLALLAGDEVRDGQSIVRRTWSDMTRQSGDAAWRKALHDGLVADSGWRMQTPSPASGALTGVIPAIQSRLEDSPSGWEVVFTAHPTVYDGRYANNGWLQELPDPVTKLTWDNAALMSPKMFAELGLDNAPTQKKTGMVTIQVNGRSVEAAAFRVPGLPDNTVVLPLGYGRGERFGGRIAREAGFNFYEVRTSGAEGYAAGASVERAGGMYTLATTQDHHTIDVETIAGEGVQQRLPSIFREATKSTYEAHPKFAHDHHYTGAHVAHKLSMFEENIYEGAVYQWGMAIDLNACTGCGACIMACQAENNIPIVGKEQVAKGREMHWLRLDRYFRFKPDEYNEEGQAVGWDPNEMEATGLQPMMCVHCENAPCEQVCPVAATVHDMDGLNVMVYNRCIGTRYCSNNCPYKVRRFNYFDYHRREPVREQDGLLQVQPDYYTQKQATPNELRQMQFNPEVSVRVRGVMEKCTYCTQRITQAKIDAKNSFVELTVEQKQNWPDGPRVPIADGTIRTACEQACPAEAIVFGDLADPDSRVSILHRNPRSYSVLEELNTKPRTEYLAKIRNPFGGGEVWDGYHGDAHGHGDGGHADEHGAEGNDHMNGNGEASDH